VSADGPDFRHFVLRSQVLSQYAAFHRALRGAGLGGRGAAARPDLAAEVRAGFRAHAAPSAGGAALSLSERKALLAAGAAQLAALRAQLGFARASAAGAPSFFPDVAPQAAAAAAAQAQAQHPDDLRYRRGEGWPWERVKG
jgi:hypothetical protein